MLTMQHEHANQAVHSVHTQITQPTNANHTAQETLLCLVKTSQTNVLKIVGPIVTCMPIMQQAHVSTTVPMAHSLIPLHANV